MSNATSISSGTSTWKIDPTHTRAGFSAKHMMFSTVRGSFKDVEGTIVIDADNPDRSGVDVDIAVATIDTGVDQRDEHLRSEDFLNAQKFPEISFRSTSVEGAAAEAGDRFKVTGDLTIRGETREVVLDAVYEGQGTDPWGGTRAGFSAKTKIDRRDFGLTWNQVLEAGGVLVGNDVKIEIEAQATLEG